MKKLLGTDQTESNIAEARLLLEDTPRRLQTMTRGISVARLTTPPKPGERSVHQIMAHLIHTEMRDAGAIYLALLVNEPLLDGLHAERHFGRLLRFDLEPFDELLGYFTLRRRVLVRVLRGLALKEWSRLVREPKKRRKESVYWRARAMAMHEPEHLQGLERDVAYSQSRPSRNRAPA